MGIRNLSSERFFGGLAQVLGIVNGRNLTASKELIVTDLSGKEVHLPTVLYCDPERLNRHPDEDFDHNLINLYPSKRNVRTSLSHKKVVRIDLSDSECPYKIGKVMCIVSEITYKDYNEFVEKIRKDGIDAIVFLSDDGKVIKLLYTGDIKKID